MKKAKTTKRAFVMSLCAMALCCTMLIGSTFAWFTDSDTSGKNKIVAGNLDIELQVKDETGAFVDATDSTDPTAENLFGVDLWEPGVVAYETFKAVNAGNLALKYNMYVSPSAANTVDGKSLADVIKVAVIKGEIATGTAREDIIKNAGEFAPIGNSTQVATGKLLPDGAAPKADLTVSSEVFTVVAYWEPTDTDNNYNLNNGKLADDGTDKLSIEFGVTLSATQVPYEVDAVDENYDDSTKIPDAAVEAITATINMGAKDANAAIAKAIKEQAAGAEVPAELVHFDNELTENAATGEKEITLHFEAGSKDYVNVTYTAVKELIGTAVNAQAGNIYSIKIDGQPVRTLNGSPIEEANPGDWVEEDLRAAVAGASGLEAALESVATEGLPVEIVSMDGETQVYRMYFDLKW